jgi:predicted nucleic acid-binding protein
MVAADSSTWIAYMGGAGGADVELLISGLRTNEVALPPVVLTELFSQPNLPAMHRGALQELPVLDVLPDYWIRAAANRATLMSRKLRARLADALIAQSCIDHDIALITRVGDFRHFAKHCGLKLA